MHQEIILEIGCIDLVEYLEVNACLYYAHTQAEITSNAVNEKNFKCKKFSYNAIGFSKHSFSEENVSKRCLLTFSLLTVE